MPITNTWIDSIDLAKDGKSLLSDLRSKIQNVEATLSDIDSEYSNLMRTSNKTEEEQDAAIYEVQNKLIILLQTMDNLKNKMLETASLMDGPYLTAINSLLEGYIPPSIEPNN